MQCSFFVAALASILFAGCVFAGDDCSSYIQNYWKKKTDVAKSGEIECAQKFGLPRFMSGGDETKEEPVYLAYVEYMQTISSEEKKEVIACFHKIADVALPQMNIPDNCKEPFKKRVDELVTLYEQQGR